MILIQSTFCQIQGYLLMVCQLSVLCARWKEIRCLYTALALWMGNKVARTKPKDTSLATLPLPYPPRPQGTELDLHSKSLKNIGGIPLLTWYKNFFFGHWAQIWTIFLKNRWLHLLSGPWVQVCLFNLNLCWCQTAADSVKPIQVCPCQYCHDLLLFSSLLPKTCFMYMF